MSTINSRIFLIGSGIVRQLLLTLKTFTFSCLSRIICRYRRFSFIFNFKSFFLKQHKNTTLTQCNLPLRRNSWCFYFQYSLKGMAIECAIGCLDDPLYTTPRKVRFFFSFSSETKTSVGGEMIFFLCSLQYLNVFCFISFTLCWWYVFIYFFTFLVFVLLYITKYYYFIHSV